MSVRRPGCTRWGLRNLLELEWEEVARRMGRSADAVRMLWTRAVRRLGDQLGEEEP
jgi:DNA-directed RNA polymerase specialized sigma24 family protein